MIEIGILLIFISIVTMIFTDFEKKPLCIIILLSISLIYSYHLFHFKPEKTIKNEYISTKILDDSMTSSVEFSSPVLIQKIKIDYPYNFIFDKYYYKIFTDLQIQNNHTVPKQHI